MEDEKSIFVVKILVRMMIIGNLIFIMLTDTSALHGIRIFGLSIWTIIANLLLLPAVIFMYKTSEEPIILGTVIFVFIIGFSAVLGISSTNVIIRSLAIAVTLILSYLVYKHYRLTGDTFFVLYFTLLIANTLDAFLQILSLPTIYISLIVEIIILIALTFTLTRYKIIDILIIIVMGVIGVLLAQFVLQFSLPITIVRTLISQILGINSGSILFISADIFFMLHFAEIFAFSTALIIKKKFTLLFLLMTGVGLGFIPLLLSRFLLFLNVKKSWMDDSS